MARSMSSSRSLLQLPLSGLRPSIRQLHISHVRPRPHSGPNARPTTPISSTSAGLGTPASTSAAASSSANGAQKPRSPHMVWYREIVPAMVPILLLSSTIFLSLTLLRTHLSHSLSLAESSTRISELEAQLEQLRRKQARLREKERRERERILPMVVERVLQRVGAMSEEEEEVEEDLPMLV